MSRLCDRRSLRPPVVMRGAQLATIAAMVAAGLGVSIVPKMMRRTDGSRQCAYQPFRADPPRREIAAAWSLLRYRTSASRAVVDLLRDELRTAHRRRSDPLFR